jgi:hypothetical protein
VDHYYGLTIYTLKNRDSPNFGWGWKRPTGYTSLVDSHYRDFIHCISATSL